MQPRVVAMQGAGEVSAASRDRVPRSCRSESTFSAAAMYLLRHVWFRFHQAVAFVKCARSATVRRSVPARSINVAVMRWVALFSLLVLSSFVHKDPRLVRTVIVLRVGVVIGNPWIRYESVNLCPSLGPLSCEGPQ